MLNYKNKKIQRIIITPGEPSGIGPDLIIMMAQKKWPVELIACTDYHLIKNRAKELKLPIKIHMYRPNTHPILHQIGEITILQIKAPYTVEPGKLNAKNSQYVLNTIIRACHGCLNKEFAALVTGPVHKGIINKSGIQFIGHTELLEKLSKSKQTVMTFINNKLRIALATHHIPISEISNKITKKLIYNVIKVLAKNLYDYFDISNPKIYVCGLNPHSGENGYLGTEEIRVINPTIDNLRNEGYNLIGPLSADSIFQTKNIKKADAILAMYHDQGLTVLKFNKFCKSVNITFGLPFIRTSVDHGTALELAGSGLITDNSIKNALKLAIKIINKKNESSKL